MAIFRAMRVGGVATFASAPAIVVVPPVTGTKPRFRVMRAPNGMALFLGAPAATAPPVDPGPYIPKSFEEQLSETLAFSYDAGDSKNYDDTLLTALGFGFAVGAELTAEDVLSEVIALGYDTVVQVQVEDQMSLTTTFDFTVRARIRGWNEDNDLPPAVWTPDPKPNLF